MSSYMFWGIYKQHVSSFNYGKIQTTGAVLVAISIPIFTSQLEKSRDAVSIANIRAAYAEATSEYMVATKDVTGSATTVGINLTAKTATVQGVVLKGTQSGFSDLEKELSFTNKLGSDDAAKGGVAGTYTLVFTYDDNGGCTVTSLTQN